MATLMACLMMVTTLSLTSCDDDDKWDTNQYKGGINLNAFGPSPVARGGELRFIGSGMDQINSVELPGCGEITDIKVISSGEIRIIVPQNAEPGYVVLHHSNGKITTLTKLTFLEPISIDGIAPLKVKAGQTITITGDYLNLIKEVCFPFTEGMDSVNVYADDFIEHTRSTIKVAVPEEAVSGVMKLSTAEEVPNVLPYEDEEIEVILPSVAAPLDLTDAKPGELVTIKGDDLDLVRKIRIEPFDDEARSRANDADDIEFTYNDEKKEITFELPDNSFDGAIVMITASGVKVACANIGMVVPTNLTAVPADNLRGGDVIKIKGVNIDQVVSVNFPGVADAVTPESVTATELSVAMPAKAQSGDLTLNLKSGKSVTVAIATAKPENIGYSANPAPAGAELKVSGKNLDLVSAIVFGGGIEVAVENPSATEFTVSVPLTAQSGAVTLKMANGESVEADVLNIDTPTIAYISEMPGDDDEIKAGEIFKFTIANEDKLTGVTVNGQPVQYILNGTNLFINFPESAGSGTKVVLVSGDESLEYTFDVIPATHVENVIWTGTFECTAWQGCQDLAWGGFDWSTVPAGAILSLQLTPLVNEGEWWCVSLRHGNDWGNLPDPIPGQYDMPGTQLDVELTANVLADLVANNGLVVSGQGYIMTRMTLSWENPTATTIWQGSYELQWGPWLFLESDLFAGAKPGAVMTFTLAPATGIMIQMNDASWSEIFTPAEWSQVVDTLTYTLTADDLNRIRTVEGNYPDDASFANPGGPFKGMIIQGMGTTITKITYENQ